jgi:enoyl-CoA hydratase
VADEPVRVRVDTFDDRVARVTLDRPPVNAADARLLSELHDAFDALRSAPVDAVVLTGAGRVFCAGNDLHEFAAMDAERAEELMYLARRAFWSVYDCPVPVVAMVNGAALGTGLALTSCCDLVVASEAATFGLPELEVGVLGGVKFAARLVPELAVRRLFLTAERVSARRFAELGAPITVVPAGELEAATHALLADVTAKSGVALRFAKQAMNAVEHMDLKAGYEYEQTFTIRMAERAEAKEAVRSVLEKRAPRFAGRPAEMC